MPDNTTTSHTGSPEKTAFLLAEQGTLEIIDLMGAADRLKSAGLKDQTISLYRLWLEHSTSPLMYVGYFNLGVELASERDYQQAESMYRKALEQNPEFVRARLNLGNCLEQQKRDDEALEQWRIALESKSILLPENISLRLHALNNLGRLLEMKKNYKESLAKLEESFALDPTQRDVLLHLVHLVQKICRWPIYVPPKGISKQEMINGTSPLAMLAATDDPALQLAAAQQFVEHKYPVTSIESLAPKFGYQHEKIRIGYLSSDFCLHAVSLLMVELLELHDHDKFEVYGFCWSRVDETSIQKRVQKSMDHYIKIGEMNDKEAADCIRSHEIDIMVDLQGLTSGARPLILSYRPAMLQMTYLGFPGTTGLPWIDYVIADKYLIPDELVPYHTEKPLYMPNCFQSSDSKREVGPMPTRADNGLPEKAFVFCSFNNNYKFTPEMFASWMRILKRVPGSVFWLLADNEWAKENLINTAKKHGIKKDRLIFAPRVAPADYLARYQLADLFLDTFPFNGGTTANDTLFMGLPLLTLSGRTFASRMAGSLLTNLGLSELITTNPKAYEEKAVRLAKRTAELNALKIRLLENKKTGPVFDMPQLVKGLECKLTEILEERQPQKSESSLHNTLRNSNITATETRPPMKIAIASIQRDRGKWIVEWLAFHMLVGFNQFYIYSHKCADDMTAKLQKLSRHYSILVHEISSDDRPQLACYQHAYNAYGSQVDWMAFIDGDEFLFPTSHSQMADALVEYEDKDLSAVAAFWKCYGSSGHIIEPEGLVVENYSRHSSPDFIPNRHVKSIIKGRQDNVIAVGSHVFQTPRGTYDELLRPINHGWMKGLEPSYEKFRINHYTTQSWEFFRSKKKSMGAADFDSSYIRPDDWYPRHDRNECDDGISYNFLVPLKLKVIELMAVIAAQ